MSLFTAFSHCLCCKVGARAQEYSRFVSREKGKKITYHIQKYILSFVKHACLTYTMQLIRQLRRDYGKH